MQSCSVKIINRVLYLMSMVVISAKTGIPETRAPNFVAKQPENKAGVTDMLSLAALIMSSLATNHPDSFTDESLKNMFRQESANII